MFKKIVIVVSLALWPINLYLTNSFSDFVSVVAPSVLLLISYVLYIRYPKYYLIPVFLISIVQINLLPFSLVFCLIEFFLHPKKENFVTAAVFLASLMIFAVSFSSFKERTLFSTNNEVQTIIQNNSKLYSNKFLAEIFQNKPTIILDKLTTNFYNLIDPNGYFFGNYPWPINVYGDSFIKFSFLTIPFIYFGLINLKKHPHKEFIIVSFVAGVVSIVFLNSIDRTDFVLWLPISLIIVFGVEYMSSKYKKLFIILSSLLIVFSIPEFLRNIVHHK